MAADERQEESALRDLNQLNEVVTNFGKRQEADSAEAKGKFEKLEGDLAKIMTTLNTIAANRRGEFEQRDADADRTVDESARQTKNGNASATRKALDQLVAWKSKDPEVVQAQEILDRSAVLGLITDTNPLETEYFRREFGGNKYLSKLLNAANTGNAGVGGAVTGWKPVEFSARMIEKIRLARLIPQLHQTFVMPADPYRIPLEGGPATVKPVGEQADADAEVTEAKKVAIGFDDFAPNHLTMTSKKWGLRVVLSNELDEDGGVAVMDLIEDQITKAVVDFRENVTVNGAVDSSLDSSVTYAGNQLLLFSGYRKQLNTVTTARVTNGSESGNTTLTEIDIVDIRKVRMQMGKHGGLNPRDIVWVCGPIGYFKLLNMKRGSSLFPLLTVDKYGPAATILTGEIGQIEGSSLVMTEFMGPPGKVEQLDTTGLAGSTTVYTEILAVKPSAFVYGQRRAPSLRGKEIIDTDQIAIIMLERGTFFNYYPNDPVVGGLVKVQV